MSLKKFFKSKKKELAVPTAAAASKNYGYWVVDSVVATMPNWKNYAAGWSSGCASAFILAESLGESYPEDFIVLDHKGTVV